MTSLLNSLLSTYPAAALCVPDTDEWTAVKCVDEEICPVAKVMCWSSKSYRIDDLESGELASYIPSLTSKRHQYVWWTSRLWVDLWPPWIWSYSVLFICSLNKPLCKPYPKRLGNHRITTFNALRRRKNVSQSIIHGNENSFWLSIRLHAQGSSRYVSGGVLPLRGLSDHKCVVYVPGGDAAPLRHHTYWYRRYLDSFVWHQFVNGVWIMRVFSGKQSKELGFAAYVNMIMK